MAYSEQILRRARERLEQAKNERERENEAHRRDAYDRYPRLAEIDRCSFDGFRYHVWFCQVYFFCPLQELLDLCRSFLFSKFDEEYYVSFRLKLLRR